MERITVYVVTPTRAMVRAELAQMWVALVTQDARYRLILSISDAQPIANNRNRIARAFLKSEADFLLTIDDDMVPTCNPLNYVEDDLDVLGFPYPTWRVNSQPPLLWYPGPPNGDGVVEVPAVGGGVLLIARRVLADPGLQAPFMDEWNEDGLRITPEDTSFCQRARIAGYRIWCDMSHPSRHFKTVELVTLWQYMMEVWESGRSEVWEDD